MSLNKTEPDFQLLTTEEVATMLNVKRSWLERMRTKKQGPPYVKIGRHVRYRLNDVLHWCRKHQIQVSLNG